MTDYAIVFWERSIWFCVIAARNELLCLFALLIIFLHTDFSIFYFHRLVKLYEVYHVIKEI